MLRVVDRLYMDGFFVVTATAIDDIRLSASCAHACIQYDFYKKT